MRIEVWAPDGVPEVTAGDDLAALVLAALGDGADLADGDVVSVTSKVVSKAEGRTRTGDRDGAIDEESVRLVARRGATRIVRHRLGLTMAAAGVDASNVALGSIVLLPLDPDASARALRRGIHERAGVNVGVVVTDTAGRAWREGQTDIAVGAAGLVVAEDFAGRTDPHGNPLAVTLPAVADELAGAAELVLGKLSGRPFAVVRGRADLVLPPGKDGPGATALVRPEGGDLFGWGAREAVVRALAGAVADRMPFGAPADRGELDAALAALPDPTDRTAVAAVCFAYGWQVDGWDEGPSGSRTDGVCRVSPVTT
ncbi:coenzyme F420-0:L-glutamate ligase [Nocardioides zhouii]|uniref:coenzyme F420-0:L-glutamate ligase n=1 Tax=Nocardioides zhouii TaxID=1168729 RepID=UPI001A92E3CC|nr:coenzyme F420-0:L-glutamate ligase [Nocardioides zhouii]